MSSLESIREENLERNRKFLESIGIIASEGAADVKSDKNSLSKYVHRSKVSPGETYSSRYQSNLRDFRDKICAEFKFLMLIALRLYEHQISLVRFFFTTDCY